MFREMANDPQRSWNGTRTPEEVFRAKIQSEAAMRHSDNEKTNSEARDFYFQLGLAWDALAYERYEPGSMPERFAANDLSTAASVKDGPGPVIKLNPVQARIIDALAEVAHIPHEKGHAEVVIPEKLRSYKWHLSAEYQDRLKAAAAKARGETGDTQRDNSRQDTIPLDRTEQLSPSHPLPLCEVCP